MVRARPSASLPCQACGRCANGPPRRPLPRIAGAVVGVIPKRLVERELAHRSLTQLHVTEDMHERKRLMAELSDGFLVLPGGYGTLEELSEILSWAQIGLHAKPCGILNVKGFYDNLLRFFDDMVRAGFLHERSRRLPIVSSDCEALIGAISASGTVLFDRWSPDSGNGQEGRPVG